MESRPRVKPRLRGVTHHAAFFIALGAGVLLVSISDGSTARWTAAVYAASLMAMFGVSAFYHRPHWSPAARRILQRFDLGAIYVLIAGTYTPICILTMGPATGGPLLAMVWTGASLGILLAILWPDAPNALLAAIYVGLGWAMVPFLPELLGSMDMLEICLIAIGGLLYTGGAIIYALRAPDPFPATFGYHEVFHALVVAASACHFAAITHLVIA